MAFRFNYATGKFEQLTAAKDPRDLNGDGIVTGPESTYNPTGTSSTTSPPRTTTTSSTAPRPTTTSSMAPTTTMAPATTTTVRPTTTTATPTTSTTVAPKATVPPTTIPAPPASSTTSTTSTTVPTSSTATNNTGMGGSRTNVAPVIPDTNIGSKPVTDEQIKAYVKIISDFAKVGDDLAAAPYQVMLKDAVDRNAAWEQDQRTIAFNKTEQILKDAKEARDAAAKAAAGSGGGSAAAIAAAKLKAEREKEKRDNEFTIARDDRAEQFRIDAENRANARTDALAEVARIRGYDGGMAAADMLESRSGQRTIAALQAVKDLYDPLDQKTAEELSTQLKQIATNFANARGQVNVAGVDFLENFAKTLAYTQVPITQFSAGQNPLMEALRQQGASTVEVQNAMDLAAATSQSTSDLAKWATSQLNITQQNMDSAAMNASRGATQTALQSLSSRQPEVEAGMTMKYNDLMATLMRERAAANASANQAGYAGQDAADSMRANTLANYGTSGTPTATVPDVVKTAEPVLATLPADPNVPNISAPKKTPEQIAAEAGRLTDEQARALEARRGY